MPWINPQTKAIITTLFGSLRCFSIVLVVGGFDWSRPTKGAPRDLDHVTSDM